MSESLLIDFGASRIKVALLKNGIISDVTDYDPVTPCVLSKTRYEVASLELKNQFLGILQDYNNKASYEKIFLCSEMHGFMLVSEDNLPLSNYISWQDERCTEDIDDTSSFSILKDKLGQGLFQKTGMRPRSCLPIFNIFHMIRMKDIPPYVKIISLPEYLCTIGGKSLKLAQDTMSAGLGFYNIFTNTYDRSLIDAMESNSKLIFNPSSSKVNIGGYVTLNNREIAIYTGVGDMQCAIWGTDSDEQSISVNLGTGSQVAVMGLQNPDVEKRPFFDGKKLGVITHIPSGRALNRFIGFLQEINPKIDFWDALSKITLSEIEVATWVIDLKLFPSCWNFNKGGSIIGIREDNFTLKNYLASLLKGYIMQYKIAIEMLQPPSYCNTIVLSGGIPAKLPVIKQYFNKMFGLQIRQTEESYDETILGLRKMAINIV